MLPAATSLQKQGANKGATTAFLISTPESGVDSIAITYALLDPVMTIVRPVAAFMTAFFAGTLENSLNWPTNVQDENKKQFLPMVNGVNGTACTSENDLQKSSFFSKLKTGVTFAINDVWGDIVFWFFTGLLLAGIITSIIPDELMAKWLGGGLASMLVMLLVGIPLYICATASTPIAAALILKGVSPGAALVFLLVGPATNITSLSVLIGILGKASTFRYLTVLASSAVLFGLGVDGLYQLLNIEPQAILGEASEIIPYEAKLFAAIFLLIISIRPVYIWFNKKTGRVNKESVISDFPSLPLQ